MNLFWKKRGVLLTLIVVLSLGMFGCGSSESKKESTGNSITTAEVTETTKPQESTGEETGSSNASEDEDKYEELKELYDVGRMGVTDAGEGVYFAATSDGSNSMIVFANPKTLESGSFVGPATISEDGEHCTITDEKSGLALTFSVKEFGNDTWVLSMGDLGEAIVAECSVSECIDALKAVDEGTIPRF